jgi:hypothetical protein
MTAIRPYFDIQPRSCARIITVCGAVIIANPLRVKTIA